MSKVLTDNSYLADKIALRLSLIPQKENLNVLDAFHGYGSIWKNIQKKYLGEIKITKIDIEQKEDAFMLIGDNLKYLTAISLEKYDVIDLDAYGIPYEQLKILFKRGYKGIVFITFIQTIFGALPTEFLNELGYTKTMIDKCPTLFYRNAVNKLLHWFIYYRHLIFSPFDIAYTTGTLLVCIPWVSIHTHIFYIYFLFLSLLITSIYIIYYYYYYVKSFLIKE